MSSISFGPFSLPTAYAVVLFAFSIAIVSATFLTRKSKQPLANALFDALLLGALASRLGFVALYFDHYRENLLSIINIRDGGFSGFFGLLAVAIVLIYQYVRHQPLRRPMLPAVFAGVLAGLILFGLVGRINHNTPPLPNVQFIDLKGKEVYLADLPKGRPMVINLWASWCPPCIREMPVLAKAQKAHPNVVFLFINQGEDQAAINTFLQKFHLQIDNILMDKERQLAQKTESNGLPTTLFYNENGQRMHTHVGELSPATLAKGMDFF